MTEKTIQDNTFSVYENPALTFDIKAKLQSGEYFCVTGLDQQKQASLAGQSVYHFNISIIDSKDSNSLQSCQLSPRDFSSDFQVTFEWMKSMVYALGRQSDKWIDYCDLHTIIDYACENAADLPAINNSQRTIEKEIDWVDYLIHRIDTDNYNYVWDFEGHRQDGEDFYNEWEQNTDELRH